MSILYAVLRGGSDQRRLFIDEYEPGLHRGRIFCPLCDGALIAKRGAVRQHAFVHARGTCCCVDRPDITPWRLKWLGSFDSNLVERRVEHGGAVHMADALTADGRVVLLRDGTISTEALNAREDFFIAATGQPPVWVLDLTMEWGADVRGEDFVVTTLRHKAWACARGTVFLDTPHGLLQVTHHSPARPKRVLTRPAALHNSTARAFTAPPTTTIRISGDAWWNNTLIHEVDKRAWAELKDLTTTPVKADWLWVRNDPDWLRDEATLSAVCHALTGRQGSMALPMGHLPQPLAHYRGKGVRHLTTSIFSNVVAKARMTERWVRFFRALGWQAEMGTDATADIHVSDGHGVLIAVFADDGSDEPLVSHSHLDMPIAFVESHPTFSSSGVCLGLMVTLEGENVAGMGGWWAARAGGKWVFLLKTHRDDDVSSPDGDHWVNEARRLWVNSTLGV